MLSVQPAVIVTATIDMTELQQQDVVNTLANTIRETYYDDKDQLFGVTYDRGKLQVVLSCQMGSADNIAA